ncbi:hypothetical protein [Phenylobacterium sp.]|uniref:hypothetical protein n=1 Tax=Phenylobacterium sp. TaxID=1871053 RepID=UPI0027359CB5|nr:hypothetical protein [Phenylobacterium sp.]MDP3853763.1 hypothetical protein [Phenylobacterium sp.]
MLSAIDGAEGNDGSRMAYMIARAALVHVQSTRGARPASEMAYRLGDEFATGDSAGD